MKTGKLINAHQDAVKPASAATSNAPMTEIKPVPATCALMVSM